MAYEPHAEPPVAIDGVLLDAGGVFLLPSDAILSTVLAPWTEVDVSAVDRSYYLAAAAFDAALAAGADWRGVGQAAQCRALGVPEEHVPAATAVLLEQTGLWSRVLPGAIEALTELAETGVPMAVVSNSGGTVEQELVDAAVCQVGRGSYTEVRAVVDSYVVGVYKPDPRIFDMGAEAVGADPSRCVHVGDLVHYDVVGAWGAGARPLHFDPFRVCPHRGAHDHVSSLADVAGLIRTLGS